ncbi:MAG: polyprenyl synthetase family protein [Candidatus Bathyarchaeota archaeon]|nr:polyprenyl synthetase family protein [Candidatus Bathyarchaeota archaeon]MDH5746465.1 polyprenyl synthetase family protein [Candidatus Bathyarchaeota archaeon]
MFEKYVDQHKENIYSKICEYLLRKTPEGHYKIVRAYTDRKGKYVRPSLLLLWAELRAAKLEDAILPAAAMQTSEDWILIHDDWEDSNELRRGEPTAHMLYGDRYAINAGDALHMIMWRMVHDASESLGTSIGARFFSKFYDMLLVTAEGQYLDMHLTHDVKDITKFTLGDYYKSISARSGYYSVYGPMQLGMIIAGKEEKDVEQIKEYGELIGKAFQMKDDILDCTSTEEALGKTIGNDVMNGAKTAILWHFVQNAKPSDLENVREIYMKDRKEKTKEEAKEVIEIFKRYGSFAYAESEVDRLAKEALEKFEEISRDIPESALKETARDAISRLTSRYK